jgi:hypothetical protein
MAAPVVHFEIQAEDPERALAFYRDVFDWSTYAPPGLEGQYWLVFPTGEKPEKVVGKGPSEGIGGGVLLRRGGPPADGAAVNAYVCVLQVKDLEKTQVAFVARGGRIATQTTEIPGVGRVFYGKDTEGNIIGVLQPTG